MDGNDIIVVWRDLASPNSATKIALQTSYEVTLTKDGDEEETKDGVDSITGAAREEATVGWQMSTKDDSYHELRDVAIRGKEGRDAEIEYWEVNLAKTDEKGEYESYYRQANITELNKTAETGSRVEIEMTLSVYKLGQYGYTPLTEAQEKVAQYAYKSIQEAEAEAQV